MDSIGKLRDGTEKRDAIHIAIAPVISASLDDLQPGQRIGFDRPGTDLYVVGNETDPIGIVDPFLTKPVAWRKKFWMFLMPNTVTSLRHEWTHPAFGKPAHDKAASEKWLRDFISNANCPSYDHVIKGILGEIVYEEDGSCYGVRLGSDYLHFSGSDASGEIPPEFWDHVEAVTGKPMRVRPSLFSCSC